MGTRVKWLDFILITLVNGAVVEDKLLMTSFPPSNQNGTLTVREGTNVSFSCYFEGGRNLTSLKWYRGIIIGTTSFNYTMKKCIIKQGQLKDIGGMSHLNCTGVSSTIEIRGVRQADSKEWTCSSTTCGQHARFTLNVRSATTTTTTTTTRRKRRTTTDPPSTSEPTTQPQATTSMMEVTSGLSTTPSRHSSSREQTTLEHRTETTGRENNGGTQLYIILASILGGAATLVLCVVLAWITRTSRKKKELNHMKTYLRCKTILLIGRPWKLPKAIPLKQEIPHHLLKLRCKTILFTGLLTIQPWTQSLS
ncbi:uncharacterized protein [Haliotis asinina]|uniref:uncharacterized protein isoform X2 n=1 Tax=Haliotis asinina TaxID=109174 RepID=UPI003531E0E3